jgi:MEMO1 family protein
LIALPGADNILQIIPVEAECLTMEEVNGGPERKKGLLLGVILISLVVVAVGLWLLPWRVMDTSAQEAQMQGKVRRPAVAGQFYPGSAATLSSTLDTYFAGAKPAPLPGRVRALIAPHAGYIYSGQVAAVGYKSLDRQFKRVFILASNHSQVYKRFAFSVSSAAFFDTPLGRVKVSPIAGELLKNKLFADVEEAQDSHVIEVQLPFLQKILTDFEIIPIVTGWVGTSEINEAAQIISRYVDDQTLIVVSSDLSHYYPYAKAVELDTSCTKALEALDVEKASSCEACGLHAALILLNIARSNGWQGKILDYKNSGDTAGSKDQVVGYSAIAYYNEQGKESLKREDKTQAGSDPAPGELTENDKRALLGLSRSALNASAAGNKMTEVDESNFSNLLRQQRACFVTLKKHGDLRGCIGRLVATEPLYICVMSNTVNAALHDTRFEPVAPDELKDIEIEVSVLSPAVSYDGERPDALVKFLAGHNRGVILKRGWNQSTFLPQVWEELVTEDEFLGHLCRKGGMEYGCWKDAATGVSTYEVVAFKEHEFGL